MPRAAARHTAALAALMLGACDTADHREGAGHTLPLEIHDDRILDGRGAVLLDIAEFPTGIAVDDQTRFGAATRFQDASLSPDGAWLAVVTSGVAHSAGWLVETATSQPWPAAFQYGGGIALGPWSGRAEYAVFIHSGPAGGQTLSAVHRQDLGDTVMDNAMPIRTPGHGARAPEQLMYDVVGWEDGALQFTVNGDTWHFEPDSGGLRPAS